MSNQANSPWRILASLALCAALSPAAWAQSSACAANEIQASLSTTALTGNNTPLAWTAGALTRNITVGTAPANVVVSLVFVPTNAIVAPYPALDALSSNRTSLEVDHDNAVRNALLSTLTVGFSRPVRKLRFVVQDVDASSANNSRYQDQVVVTGDNAGTAVIPTLVSSGNPVIAANTATAAYPSSCTTTQGNCNVTNNFAGTVTSATVQYRAGPATGTQTTALQAMAIDDFAFCIPVPDLQVAKATPAVVQGGTAAYSFVVANTTGQEATSGTTSIVDVLPAGLSFPTPLTATGTNGANWTCVVGTTSAANDTATCTSTTAIPVAGSSSFTLTANVAATATGTVDNRGKVFGGGDPDKTALTSTGTVAACTAASENTAGNAANAGCAFEQSTVVRQSDLAVTKTDGVSSVVSGSNNVYTIVYTNNGPSPAGNTTITDPLAPALDCASVTCSAAGGAVCPAGLTVASLQAGAVVPTFPPGSTVTLALTCNITATGN